MVYSSTLILITGSPFLNRGRSNPGWDTGICKIIYQELYCQHMNHFKLRLHRKIFKSQYITLLTARANSLAQYPRNFPTASAPITTPIRGQTDSRTGADPALCRLQGKEYDIFSPG